MEVLHHPGDRPAPLCGCAVSIGAYDGVHLGHRRLISLVRKVAAERDLVSAVVTFDQHPATIVRPDSAPKLLTDLDQKLELLDGTGIDVTLVVHFDQERSEESPEAFVEEVLVRRLGARAVVVGHDFHFGYRRRGDVALLEGMGAELGFAVEGIDLFPAGPGGQPVSSTRIRALLAEGSVGDAASLLGRPHQVRGHVVPGDRRGRLLGFPTANVAVPASIVLPADGVYAGWYQQPDGLRRPAAVSLGRRPTFYAGSDLLLLEAHLLDFDGDLYGEAAAVEFVARLRGQDRFEAVHDLVAQMAADVSTTRHVLDVAERPTG